MKVDLSACGFHVLCVKFPQHTSVHRTKWSSSEKAHKWQLATCWQACNFHMKEPIAVYAYFNLAFLENELNELIAPSKTTVGVGCK